MSEQPSFPVNILFHGIGTPRRELEPGEDAYWVGRDQFEALLAAKRAVIFPGTTIALFARVIVDLDFEGVYVTGAGIANMSLGVLDVGLVSRRKGSPKRVLARCCVPMPRYRQRSRRSAMSSVRSSKTGRSTKCASALPRSTSASARLTSIATARSRRATAADEGLHP